MASENVKNQFLDIVGTAHLLDLINQAYALKNKVDFITLTTNDFDFNDIIANEFPKRVWIDNDILIFNKPDNTLLVYLYHDTKWYKLSNDSSGGTVIDPEDVKIAIATYEKAGIVKPNENSFIIDETSGDLSINDTFITNFISSNRAETSGLISEDDQTKLDEIEEKAQVNTIEKIMIGETELDINSENKSVTVPTASSTLLGLIKGTENKFIVSEKGEVTGIDSSLITGKIDIDLGEITAGISVK